MPSADDYARDLIGHQAMQIISLRTQLDAAQEQIRQLEHAVCQAKGQTPPLRAVERVTEA